MTDWVVGGGGGDMTDDSCRDPLPVFSAGDPYQQFWHVQGCPYFDVVHLAFLLPTTVSSILQGAPKDGFGEAVVV